MLPSLALMTTQSDALRIVIFTPRAEPGGADSALGSGRPSSPDLPAWRRRHGRRPVVLGEDNRVLRVSYMPRSRTNLQIKVGGAGFYAVP